MQPINVYIFIDCYYFTLDSSLRLMTHYSLLLPLFFNVLYEKK